MTVGLVRHASALDHDAGRGHPERPERIEAILGGLERCGLAQRLDHHEPEPARREVLELVHEAAYLDLLERIDADGGARLDPDTRMGPGSLEASLRATQGACDGVDRVTSGEWDAAFVCMRPPGHHATPSRAMGFCLTNHAAVAARYAISAGHASRVLICDWDAHHGNGTQDAFWTDPEVLYVSLHQYPFYPGTGAIDETGSGPGAGTTVNIPLPAGTAEDAYRRAFDEVIVPVARGFAPELVVVSAGYDAHASDPLCMMRLTAGAFHRFARAVADLGPGPVCVLEGGYDTDALAWCACATIAALCGEDPVGVPEAELMSLEGTRDAIAWVERAVSVHGG